MAEANPCPMNLPLPLPELMTEDEFLDSDRLSKASRVLDKPPLRLIRTCRPRKNKTWKYQKTKSERVKLSKLPKYVLESKLASDSDSSLDNWIDRKMDVSQKCVSHCTDSDEVSMTRNDFTEWRSNLNTGESDSVSESHHFSHENRRRKSKQMVITPPKYKRNRNSKLSRSLKVPIEQSEACNIPELHSIENWEDMCPDVIPNVKCGSKVSSQKRKLIPIWEFMPPPDPYPFGKDFVLSPPSSPLSWSMDFSGEESFDDSSVSKSKKESSPCEKKSLSRRKKSECGRSNNGTDDEGNNGTDDESNNETKVESAAERWFRIYGSSDKESEYELSNDETNDESREADDEQSDFFCDKGTANVMEEDTKCENNEKVMGVTQKQISIETDSLCYWFREKFEITSLPKCFVQRRRDCLYETHKKKLEDFGGKYFQQNLSKLRKAYYANSWIGDAESYRKNRMK